MAEGYGHRADRYGPIRRLKHRLNRQVFAGASHCVGWSSWAAKSIVEDYGVDPARVSVIPPGVDTSRWHPVDRAASDDFRVLFVGGEFGRKGGELLLEAFKSLSPRAELYIVTKTAIAPSDRVHIVNDLGPNDPRLIDLYRSSDVFALPSLAETFGIAAVEASAMGLPVVASSSGGLTEIVVDGETGLTVVPGDIDSLATALVRLERDPALRRRLGQGARTRALERFDVATNAVQLFELARQAAQE
jgi:glycosyltransferase involved in cell wall biosynthesis